jgi:hypothetical protein
MMVAAVPVAVAIPSRVTIPAIMAIPAALLMIAIAPALRLRGSRAHQACGSEPGNGEKLNQFHRFVLSRSMRKD